MRMSIEIEDQAIDVTMYDDHWLLCITNIKTGEIIETKEFKTFEDAQEYVDTKLEDVKGRFNNKN
jgi:hypothetical protein